MNVWEGKGWNHYEWITIKENTFLRHLVKCRIPWGDSRVVTCFSLWYKCYKKKAKINEWLCKTRQRQIRSEWWSETGTFFRCFTKSIQWCVHQQRLMYLITVSMFDWPLFDSHTGVFLFYSHSYRVPITHCVTSDDVTITYRWLKNCKEVPDGDKTNKSKYEIEGW